LSTGWARQLLTARECAQVCTCFHTFSVPTSGRPPNSLCTRALFSTASEDNQRVDHRAGISFRSINSKVSFTVRHQGRYEVVVQPPIRTPSEPAWCATFASLGCAGMPQPGRMTCQCWAAPAGKPYSPLAFLDGFAVHTVLLLEVQEWYQTRPSPCCPSRLQDSGLSWSSHAP
jgi:hypothetical protein